MRAADEDDGRERIFFVAHLLHPRFDGAEAIGYWSMLDVLVVAIVTALAQFKALGVAEPRLGIVLFGLVVVLTMLSALSFDGRSTWDRQVAHG